jgi:signal transduction histidine kinase
MKERTLQFNGQLNIENVSEGGTKLTLAIPKPGNN